MICSATQRASSSGLSAREHDQPRYIIDLLARIVTVSVETVGTVDGLPRLDPMLLG